jgi:hypothetical protein
MESRVVAPPATPSLFIFFLYGVKTSQRWSGGVRILVQMGQDFFFLFMNEKKKFQVEKEMIKNIIEYN